ncbi:adenylate/guanylate cyclase domain-containing protein [Mycolicibacterium tusciae]|uniref:adenylate/guanylate cyclase domain-containing protein n=1 Tax=Mycolicibacterium tusciae TaxID=75922 RepID=UPI001F4278A7|nr:adenylate/guanylate cyclase domain-containing protein [Mycolicibacterium tusciae]
MTTTLRRRSLARAICWAHLTNWYQSAIPRRSQPAWSLQLGLDDTVISELAEILDWNDVGAGTESDVATLQVLVKALALGMPSDALMQLIRVFADATDRLADAIVRTYHDYVHERFRAQGLTGPELLAASEGVGKPLLDLVDPTVMYFLRRAYQRANREDLLRHLAEPTTPPSTTPGEERATVLFVDLASFTSLTATMGDHAAADVLRRFSITVRSRASRHRGVLKQIGDEYMLMFAQPADAIAFGLAMDRFVDAEPQFPALHIGAHSGTVLYREGDYVGGTINLAARVASVGAVGQFLITEDLRDAAGPHPEADFTALPPQRLKGIHDPICLVEVRRRIRSRSDRTTDPVCGMMLHPADVAAQLYWAERTFAFCSETCKQAFADRPNQFVTTDPR